MIAKEILTKEQYKSLSPYDDVLTKLAQNRYVNYKTEVDPFPVLLEVYGTLFKRANGRSYIHRKTTCGSCSGTVTWAKRLGRYYMNYKNKVDGKERSIKDRTLEVRNQF